MAISLKQKVNVIISRDENQHQSYTYITWQNLRVITILMIKLIDDDGSLSKKTMHNYM